MIYEKNTAGDREVINVYVMTSGQWKMQKEVYELRSTGMNTIMTGGFKLDKSILNWVDELR